MRIQMMTFAGLLLAASAATAGGDADAGKEIATSRCAACHGADGNATIGMYPRLAGQQEDYLYFSLVGYKNGTRNNPIMAGQLSGLSDDDLRNVSAYFADQAGLKVVPTPEGK